MKILSRYKMGKVTLLLVRGNLFQDSSLQTIVITGRMLKENTDFFKVKCTEFKFPALESTFWLFYKDKCVSREIFGRTMLQDTQHFYRLSSGPVWFDKVLSLPVYDGLLKPVVLTIANRPIILISSDDYGSGPRNEVKESFLKVLKIASDNALSPIGCVPFAYAWEERNAVVGIVDSIRNFVPNQEIDIRIFEYNTEKEYLSFDPIKEELADRY